jgi:hypothetical protein
MPLAYLSCARSRKLKQIGSFEAALRFFRVCYSPSGEEDRYFDWYSKTVLSLLIPSGNFQVEFV